MSSRALGIAAVIVGVAIAALVVVLVVVQLSRPSAAGPSADPSRSPTARPTPSVSPDPTAEPSASEEPTDAELAALFAEIEQQVIELRGLARAEIPPAEVLTRQELRDELEQSFEEEYPESERRADNVTYRAIGVLEPDEDLAELQLRLLGEQVIGFYDDVDKRMAVVSDGPLDGQGKMTYAHEYTHALQDANFGLDTMRLDVEGDDDAAMARLSVVEGDATLTMSYWAGENLTPEEIFGGGGGGPGDLSQVPDFLIESLIFPYTGGANFVAGVFAEGGFAAVNDLYTDPPQSTEQVIHPEKYIAREAPVAVDVPDLAAQLGPGWETLESTPIGEATLQILLDDLGVPALEAQDAAAGWGGDRLTVAAGPDDAFALAWLFVFDSQPDAAEFAAAYRSIEGLDFPARLVEETDGSILVVHASSEQVLDSILALAR